MEDQDQPAKSRTKRKVIKVPRKLTGADRTTTWAGRPPNFQRLERFFASQTALARALGVHRDTIRAWSTVIPPGCATAPSSA